MRNNQKRLSTPTSTDNLQPNTEVPPQAPTLEFIVPTEIVELPSKGLFYEEGHPLHNRTSVEIKHMTTKEEDLITNESLLKSGLAIDRLLQSVLVDPKMNINDMSASDEEYAKYINDFMNYEKKKVDLKGILISELKEVMSIKKTINR